MKAINIPFWPPLMMAVIAIPLTLWALRNRKRRTQEFASVALQLGFKFVGNRWSGPALSPVHKTCIIQRTRGGFNNVMLGSVAGMEVAVFDYVYQVGKSVATLSLAAFARDHELPPFELRSESVFDKIGEAFGHRDIDFESNPEFSRRYFLRSPDEASARALFTPGLLAYFEQIPAEKKWLVEASGKTLIIYGYQQFVKGSHIPAFLNEASEIARIILSAAQ